MAAVRKKVRQSNTPAYHGRPHIATVVKTECTEIEGPIRPTVSLRHHPIRLLTIPIDDAWPGYVVLTFFRRERVIG